MTKRWSSTASMDGQTKRQASKAARREWNEVTAEEVAAIDRLVSSEFEHGDWKVVETE